MYFKWLRNIGAGLLAIALVCGTQASIPVFAAADNIEIILTDVTQDDQTTLLGEAKIKVSVKGAGGSVTAAQVALKFDGDLKYKSIDFLQGENNPPQCVLIPPNAALANVTGKLLPSIVTNNAGKLTFTDAETDLFVITFAGDPGDSVTLRLDNESAAKSYVTLGGSDIETASDATEEETATASSEDNAGVTAAVKLTMDKVDDFTVSTESGYADSKMILTITNERTGSTIHTVFNTVSITKGGHYDSSSSVPTFVVENTVVGGATYTVELKGNGYKTYTRSGITFAETLELTNSDFIPGDVNMDGEVNSADKTAFEEIKNGSYNDCADFNRDGVVDNYDDVFEGIDDDDNAGTSGDSTGGDSTSGDSSSSAGTGGAGTGGDSTGGGSAGGAGGGGSAGGGGGGGASASGGLTIPSANEPFTDLGNYAWAKDSIYTLKNKGIISGISETEYAPANNIKRGDFILILTRMLSINDAFTENFADVPASSYYYNAIGSAKVAGIAQGSGENFMPENTTTRQDLITLAYRAFLAKGYITETDDMASLDAFADKGNMSDYALAPMAAMVKAGIIQGSGGNVNPLGYATRAEVAVMCARLAGLMN